MRISTADAQKRWRLSQMEILQLQVEGRHRVGFGELSLVKVLAKSREKFRGDAAAFLDRRRCVLAWNACMHGEAYVER